MAKLSIPLDIKQDNEEINGVVYELRCKECERKGMHTSYIGETGRSLKQRIQEHLRVGIGVKSNIFCITNNGTLVKGAWKSAG